jgi:hypothetical protein
MQKQVIRKRRLGAMPRFPRAIGVGVCPELKAELWRCGVTGRPQPKAVNQRKIRKQRRRGWRV